MATVVCPLCGSPCILKVVAMKDDHWCKVDVCKMCLTMYPREGAALRKARYGSKPRAKAKRGRKPKKR